MAGLPDHWTLCDEETEKESLRAYYIDCRTEWKPKPWTMHLWALPMPDGPPATHCMPECVLNSSEHA
jgi:hypothetical protein